MSFVSTMRKIRLSRQKAWDHAWQLIGGAVGISSQQPTEAQQRLHATLQSLHDLEISPAVVTQVANLVLLAQKVEREGRAPAPSREAAPLDDALRKINEIRNSIIGLQTLNWSEHVYPLVAALDAAGYEGMGYPTAREYFGTLLERAVKAEEALAQQSAQKDGVS